jgi:DNA helicase-2/ATP-dependent DNA helicase PcrA
MLKYTEEQQKIIESLDNQLRVIASPGSGKTSVVIGRIVELIKRGIAPEKIFVICFAKHDKKNIIARLSKFLPFFIIQKIQINNYHSYGLNLIRQHGIYGRPGDEIKLLDESESYALIRKTLEQIYTKSTSSDKEAQFVFKAVKKLGFVDEVFGIFNIVRDEYCLNLADVRNQIKNPGFEALDEHFENSIKTMNKRALDFENDDYEFDIKSYNLITRNDLLHLCEAYGEYCEKHGYIDFMDMILQAYLLLKRNPVLLDKVSDNIDEVLVDEFQDVSNLQFQLISLLTKKNDKIFAVGDIDQCQPKGTMISLTGGGKKPIEKIAVGDQVVTYSRRHAFFVGMKRDGKKVSKISSRNYNGELVEISTNTKKTKCTPDHIWITRFKNKATNHFVTYLMKKGPYFRVGYCQLFNVDKLFHLGARSRIEEAESTWILGVHSNKRDALIEESTIAAKFGLPTVIFQQTNDSVHFDQDALDKIHNSLLPLEEKAKTLLAYFGRNIHHPFYCYKDWLPKGRKTILEIEACNLLPDLMLLPDFNNKKNVTWIDFNIKKSIEKTVVYSLNVDDDHTYISDGLATHNCVYEWRNSKPRFMKDELPIRYKKLVTLPLTTNFRSDENIVKLANKLIINNIDRLPLQMKAFFPAKEPIVFKKSLSILDQATEIADLVEKLLDHNKANYYVEKDHKIAIIVRSARSINAHSIRNALFKKQIPVQLRFESIIEKIMSFVCSLCNLTIDPKSPADLISILGILPGFGEKTLLRLRTELEQGSDLLTAAHLAKVPKTKMEMVKDCANYINRLHEDYTDNQNIKISTLGFFQREFHLANYLRDSFSQGKGFLENTSLIDSTIEEIKASEEKFIDYRDTLTAGLSSINQQDANRKPAVLLCTAHHAKGGEWEFVICPDLVTGGSGFPIGKNIESEEERRTFYVAITRAMKKLYLYSYSLDIQKSPVAPSPYIRELGLNQLNNKSFADLHAELQKKYPPVQNPLFLKRKGTP